MSEIKEWPRNLFLVVLLFGGETATGRTRPDHPQGWSGPPVQSLFVGRTAINLNVRVCATFASENVKVIVRFVSCRFCFCAGKLRARYSGTPSAAIRRVGCVNNVSVPNLFRVAFVVARETCVRTYPVTFATATRVYGRVSDKSGPEIYIV